MMRCQRNRLSMSNQPILSLMPILMLSGCAFYSTYPVYDYERANAQTVISSAEFSGELFMTEFRGAGVTFGAAYNNVYVGSTSTRTRMWQDPNAERFVDRVESAGISVRSPDPKYTIDGSCLLLFFGKGYGNISRIDRPFGCREGIWCARMRMLVGRKWISKTII